MVRTGKYLNVCNLDIPAKYDIFVTFAECCDITEAELYMVGEALEPIIIEAVKSGISPIEAAEAKLIELEGQEEYEDALAWGYEVTEGRL